jgi:hypothetical protein
VPTVALATPAIMWLQPSTTCLVVALQSSAAVVKRSFGLPGPVRPLSPPLRLLPLQLRVDDEGSLTY